jgi:hypothetical protein
MPSRRNQIRAYQFLRRRAVAALLSGDPDDRGGQLRRISRTTFAGVMIAILLVTAFLLYGTLRHGHATQAGHAAALAGPAQRTSGGTR